MKPKASLRFFLRSSGLALLVAPCLQAATYYWDDNADGAGFGTAGTNTGTWTAPTAGPTAGWSLSGTGADVFTSYTTSVADTVSFGNGATGLAAGSITVSGTVETGNMTFASGSGAITLSGGTITLGGGRTITTNYTSGVNVNRAINSEISLTGATTVSVGDTGTGGGTRTLTLGKLSGTGGTTFQYTGGNNGIGLIVLNQEGTYTGNTLISTSLTNANTEVRLGVNNALPTTTIVTIGGAAGTGTSPGRETQLNLNGKSQTLAGLATSGGGTLRTQNVFSSSAATLTINDDGSRTFAGRIGNGGTNVTIVKDGTGNWTLSGANTYVGTTTISGGTITISNATALGTNAGNTVVASGARLFVGTTGLSVAEPLNISGTGIAGANGAIHIGGNATGVALTGAITLAGPSTIQTDGSTGTTFSGGIDTAGNALTFNGSGTSTVSTTGIGGDGGSVTKNTGGTLNLNVGNTYTGLTTVNGGAVVVRNADSLGTTAAGTVVNGGGTGSANNARLDVADGTTVTGEAVTISGVGNFTGALTSTTGSNVWAGPVTLGASGTRIGASAGASLEVSGVIDSGVNAFGPIIRTTDLTGVVVFSGANTYLGATQVLIGKLQLAGGDNRLPVGTTLQLASSGTNPDAELDLNGTNQEVAGIALTGSGVATKNSVNNSSGTLSTLTVNTAAPSSFGGIIKGNLTLTKTGADSLTLTGVNTYTGVTTVSAGKLFVNGDQSAASGAVGVAANATLGGTGIMGGDVTIADNGKLEFNISTPAAGHDKLELVAGKVLDLDGSSTLTITSAGGASTGLYTLVSAPGGITGSVPATVNLPSGWFADPPAIVGGTDLVINITDTGAVTYASWSGGAAADADSNNDGVLNGVAWALGASDVNANAIGLLPDFDNTTDPTYALFTFQRSDDAEADPNTTIQVEYGNNLTGWTPAVHDGDNVIITVDDQSPNDNVSVKLKRANLALAGKLFARLKVVVTP